MEEEIISADAEQGEARSNEEESGTDRSGLEETEVKEDEADEPEAEDCEVEPEAEDREVEPEAEDREVEPEAEDPEVLQAEGEAGGELSNSSPAKRGRGKSQGSKKLKVSVTDVTLTNLVSGISNGGSPQPKRGRGRPRLSDTKQAELQESEGDQTDDPATTSKSPGRPKGSKNKTSNGNSNITDDSPKKRGRPKKNFIPETTAGEVLPNGGSNVPKKGRGRPKGSFKRKLENSTECEKNEGHSGEPRKRGRPKGSPNKKPRLRSLLGMEEEAEGSLSSGREADGNDSDYSTQDLSNGSVNTPGRGRARPRRKKVQENGSQLVKRGRGRPRGSLNKKVNCKVGRPPKIQLLPPSRKPKRGRPRNGPVKRGRPRKYPLPSPDEQKKPKVWKVLGRPRKYPRVDPPEGAPLSPKRSRGRPRKSESKKAAHLRMKPPATPSTPRNPKDEAPRKRGRPPSSAKSEAGTPKKRGRPKSSIVNNETVLDSELPNCLTEATYSAAVEEKETNENLEILPTGNSSSTESEVVTVKKRGRPKGSGKTKIRRETQLDSETQNLSIDAADSTASEEKEANENAEMSSTEGDAKSSSAPTTPGKPVDETPRKRGRPSSSVKREVNPERKRGRPKASASKNKIGSEGDSSAVGEKEVDLNIELMPIEGDDAEETLVDQDTGVEVSSQA